MIERSKRLGGRRTERPSATVIAKALGIGRASVYRVGSWLIKAFEPKAQACEYQSADDNAKEGEGGVTR
jgi:hypothetical protein